MHRIKPFWFLATLIFLIFSSCKNNTDKQIIVHAEIGYEQKIYPDDPYEVVFQFCENFSALSHLEEQPYSRNAAEFLSTNRLLGMEPYSGSMASKIIQFTGFNNAPELGFHIMGVIETTEQAWVETRWNLLGYENSDIMIKTFYLIKEDNFWKIEEIH
jgi:hypothetical protein